MLTVNKIGGANMAQLDLVKRLIDTLENRGENIVLVVSAFEGVTNTLTKAMDDLSGTDYTPETIEQAFALTRKKHEDIIAKFFTGDYAKAAQDIYTTAFIVLKESLMTHKAISNVLMPLEGSFAIRDQVIGFGENIAGALLSAYLAQEGKKAGFVGKAEADQDTLTQGPVTDRSLHEAKRKGIVKTLKKAADSTKAKTIRILGGHVAGTPRGLVVHQGRGYSDIMAIDTTLALEDGGEHVRATRFWKNVDGVYTANPKDLDPEKSKPVLHRDISSEEALENASAGSGLVNVNALSLAEKHDIDVEIRNIQKLDPDFGTNITTGEVNTKYLFKTIVSNNNVDAVTIILAEMADKDGFAAAIMQKFAHHEINIDQVGTEGMSMTFSVPLPPDRADQEAYRAHIRNAISDLKVIEVKGERITGQKIEWDKERFASVSVIGRELQNRRGILGSISSTFGAFGINVHTISHGKQQTRVTYLIDRRDRKKAVRLLHLIYVDNDHETKAERNTRVAALEDEITGTFNG